MATLTKLQLELRRRASPAKAKVLRRFFKTGRGEYGAGDVFLGVVVPDIRAAIRQYTNLSFAVLRQLLKSKNHEERLAALLILVYRYEHGTPQEREWVFQFYLRSTKYINNWDLVDLSAPQVVGTHLVGKSTALLTKLARSRNLWERRIAVLATFSFIRYGRYTETLRLARLLLADEHDLIHKAMGWMLREVGKRSQPTLEKFLKQYASRLPRTMLRYAIERLPEATRLRYLAT